MSETEGFAVFDAVLKAARRHGVRWETDYPMRKLTTFRTGGPASLLVQPNSEGALQDILQAALSENIPYCVIGNGSNLLVSDEGFYGLVIRIGAEMSGIEELGGGRLRVEAGASMSTLCNAACKLGLSGLEFAFGIPGTAGGAAVMNAGAYGGEMRDVLLSCDHLDSRGNPGAFTGEALDLSYRHSAYSAGGYILTALTLRLMPDSTQAIRARMEENLRRRKEKQPFHPFETFRLVYTHEVQILPVCPYGPEGGEIVFDSVCGFLVFLLFRYEYRDMVRHRCESGVEFPASACDFFRVKAYRMSFRNLVQVSEEASRHLFSFRCGRVAVAEYYRQGSGLPEGVPV